MSGFNEESMQSYPFADRIPPSNWRLVDLEQISVDVSPGFASGKHNSNGSGVPHLRPMNVDRDGQIDLNVVKSVADSNGIELQTGDVLFNNTNSAELVGKTAVVSTREAGYCFSNHMTRIRPESGISPVFAARQLHFLWMTGYLKRRCTNHVNQASISSRTLAKTIPFLLPPAAEQTRIVAKLEELLSDLDAGVAELKAAQKKLAQYRQSLLKAAVEGALTAEWRAKHAPAETGAQLLARILAERRARWEARQLAKFAEQGKPPPKDWQKKYPEPVQPNTSGLPELPQGWVWASLDQLLVQLRSGSAETSIREPTEFPVLKSSAVRPGSIDYRALNYLSSTQSRAENQLERGDLLISRLSGSVEYVGCCAQVDQLPSHSVQYPDRLFCGKLVGHMKTLGSHIVICISGPYARAIIEKAAKSTAGHKRISLSDLHPFAIGLPSLQEAEELARHVETALGEVSRLEAAIQLALKQSTAQRQNILRAAFAGQLVPQDPSDEPASMLLERIRAERAAQAAAKKPRGRKSRETA
ncbi:MAG: restriction endonuclease subunit S [Rhodoferax sp.]|nr:restriction endonuclease subunit S [Rhodoferax sp.]